MSTTSTPTTSRTPRTGFIVCLVIAIALLVVSIIAYPHMAPELVTRPAGNGHGENSPSREFTAFVPPLILVVVAGLVALAPRFNPRFLERFPAGAVANTENSTKVLNCVLVLVGVLIGRPAPRAHRPLRGHQRAPGGHHDDGRRHRCHRPGSRPALDPPPCPGPAPRDDSTTPPSSTTAPEAPAPTARPDTCSWPPACSRSSWPGSPRQPQ